MFLLSIAAIINKLLGVFRTALLLYLIGDSEEYSELLSYIYIVQLFLLPFDYSFLNTLFTELKFEKYIIRKLLYASFLSVILLGIIVIYKGNLVYALLSVVYYIFALLGSIGILLLNRLRYFKFYFISSVTSSIVLLLSVFFVEFSVSMLYLGRIVSVFPLVVGVIFVHKKVLLSEESYTLREILYKLVASLKMNKTTVAMIVLPLFLSVLSFNLTYYAYALSVSGIVNTVLVRNSQLLTMARISNSINLKNATLLFSLLSLASLGLPSQVYLIQSLDLVLLLRYVFFNSAILLFLGGSDIELAKNVTS